MQVVKKSVEIKVAKRIQQLSPAFERDQFIATLSGRFLARFVTKDGKVVMGIN